MRQCSQARQEGREGQEPHKPRTNSGPHSARGVNTVSSPDLGMVPSLPDCCLASYAEFVLSIADSGMPCWVMPQASPREPRASAMVNLHASERICLCSLSWKRTKTGTSASAHSFFKRRAQGMPRTDSPCAACVGREHKQGPLLLIFPFRLSGEHSGVLCCSQSSENWYAGTNTSLSRLAFCSLCLPLPCGTRCTPGRAEDCA